MKSKIILVLFSFIFSVFLFAAENKIEIKEVLENPKTITDESFAGLRQKSKWQFSGGIGLIAYELNLGYFLKPNLLLRATYLNQLDVFQADSRFLQLGVLYFPGESTFFRGSLANRKGHSVNYFESIVGEAGVSDRNDFGFDFGVGSMWNLENYTVGCEWLGVYLPVTKRRDSTFEFQFRLALLQVGYVW